MRSRSSASLAVPRLGAPSLRDRGIGTGIKKRIAVIPTAAMANAVVSGIMNALLRPAMLSEPLLAHPAETGGVDATWHPHPGDDDDRDQHHDDADGEQHMVVAANQGGVWRW